MIFEAHYLDVIKKNLVKKLTSVIGKLKAKWWSVQLGKNNTFNGKIYFRRLPKSNIKIGDNCRFNSSYRSNLIGVNHPCIISTLDQNAKIIIGTNCGFSGTVIGAFKEIKIGDNVKCGANTTITDSNWHPDDYRSGEPKPISIGNNVWLGINSIVLKGVSIGDNTVIGANSVVSKNIPANVIAAGNPCTVIKTIQREKKL